MIPAWFLLIFVPIFIILWELLKMLFVAWHEILHKGVKGIK
jgi:hypothetical protein